LKKLSLKGTLKYYTNLNMYANFVTIFNIDMYIILL